MASAGIVALQTMVDRLIEDHRRAQLLAERIRAIPGIRVEPPVIVTWDPCSLQFNGESGVSFLASCGLFFQS
ncbi:hypothetical protein NKI80_30335, partial [Mesorhizobium sp. M0387]